MGSEWQHTTIGDQVTLQRGFDITRKQQRLGKVPVVSSGGISSYHDTAKQSGPGVVMGRKGSLGTVFYIEDDYWPHDTTLWIKDFHGNDERFSYYFFKDLAPHLLSMDVGAANPTLNRNHVHPIEIRWPPLPEQKAIAHILGALDDKIELNRRMNATLEGMAQALFKSWFVDFDPVIDNALAAGNPIPEELAPRAEVRRKALANRDIAQQFPDAFEETDELGRIPKGWQAAKLGDYLEIKRGGSPRPIHDYLRPEGLPWVKIADATASTSRFLFGTKEFIKPEGLKKTVLMKTGSLILSNSATPGLPIFLKLDACIHDGWLHFPQKRHFTDLYLYQLFLVIREELVGRGNGSVFTNLKTDILRAQNIAVPPLSLIAQFEDAVQPMFKRLLALNIEIGSLTKLRDTLLPKLISGELRLPEAEQFTEETVHA